jgi:hypothetical protein
MLGSSAEGGQEELTLVSAARCDLAFTCISFGELSEEKRDGEVHDSVGGCACNTNDSTVPFQRPVARVVFLQDAITHGEACMCE